MNLSYNSGQSTFTRADFTGFVWDPPATPDWNADLVPQFSDINLFGTDLTGINVFTMFHSPSGTTFTFASASPIPEPSEYALAFAGLMAGAAAVRTYRKKRLASRA